MRACASGLEDLEAKTDADKLSQSDKSDSEEKQASPALVKIPSRLQEDPDKCMWRKFTQSENTCKRCVARTTKQSFGSRKRMRNPATNYIFPCDVGMKAFLRKVRSLLQDRIAKIASTHYDVSGMSIFSMSEEIVSFALKKMVSEEILNIGE